MHLCARLCFHVVHSGESIHSERVCWVGAAGLYNDASAPPLAPVGILKTLFLVLATEARVRQRTSLS